jgi:membrane protease YdiL (CAAX protease family)
MNIKKMFNYPVCTEIPTRKRMIVTMLIVWVAWFYANLGPNGIFYISLHGNPGLRIAGEILYYAGVSIVGIVAALHLSHKWKLDLSLFPKKPGLGFWIGSGVFLILAILLGIAALSDFNMTLADIFEHSFTWIIAPLFVLVPTMIAYTLLWYGLLLRGFERVFGGSKWATALAIIVSAFLYGIYHFASIDEITTLESMIEEILITTGIGIAFGLYVVLFRSLLVAFLVNWILNWFVFTPVDTFHPPVYLWPLGYIVLLGVWLVYRFLWIEESSEVK